MVSGVFVANSIENYHTVTMTMKDQFDSNELPEDYVPSDYDVICGWARQNYHHGKCPIDRRSCGLLFRVS